MATTKWLLEILPSFDPILDPSWDISSQRKVTIVPMNTEARRLDSVARCGNIEEYCEILEDNNVTKYFSLFVESKRKNFQKLTLRIFFKLLCHRKLFHLLIQPDVSRSDILNSRTLSGPGIVTSKSNN
ncbi:hypothetical protein K0M31_002849 [Melipona bicolor]|uniref:Uncharacterized protein n=1 Tax=Melipona bicolor TaxID=60889 RepID=A0AA40KPW0_9HYME|nr:hypothetical protein K0M31_002849 [Melipona bicolor]